MAHVEDRWSTEPSRKRQGLRWRVRYRDDLAKHRTRSFRIRTEAERFAREVERDLDHGTYVDPSAGQVTFEDFARRWLSSAPDLRPRTRENYDGIIRNHLIPAFGKTPLSRLRPEHFRDLIRSKQAQGLAVKDTSSDDDLGQTDRSTVFNDPQNCRHRSDTDHQSGRGRPASQRDDTGDAVPHRRGTCTVGRGSAPPLPGLRSYRWCTRRQER